MTETMSGGGGREGDLQSTREQQVEVACEVMHDAYEKAAVGAGWETNPASRKPWSEVPEASKASMRAAITALLDGPVARMVAEAERAGAVKALNLLAAEWYGDRRAASDFASPFSARDWILSESRRIMREEVCRG